jgi:hypothetical protein
LDTRIGTDQSGPSGCERSEVMTIPDYDEGQFPHPKGPETMSDVAKKLAAAGWSDHDSTGDKITKIRSIPGTYWIVGEAGGCVAMWGRDGTCEMGRGDLVPLPAPSTPERLTPMSEDDLHSVACGNGAWRQLQPLARELIETRKTIAELQSGLDRFRQRIQDVEADRSEVAAERDQQAAEIERLTKRCKENVGRTRDFQEQAETLKRERDAAIEIARRLCEALEYPIWRHRDKEAMAEFHRRYDTPESPPCDPPPTTEPVCHCGEAMSSHSAWGSCTSPKEMPPPTCEPIEPATEAIEFVRYRGKPHKLYRPVSITRDVDGSVIEVDCGAVILSRSHGLEAKIYGQWRAI